MSIVYGTAPTNQTSQWHPEPTFRGTFGIISSCLITMTLCIWTAVHLNIPEHGHREYITRQTGRKILWLLAGLFAPEVIAWTASEQRREASLICNEMRKILGQKPRQGFLTRWSTFCIPWRKRTKSAASELRVEKIQLAQRHEWTLVHGFYVLMGGFGLEVRDKELNFLASKEYPEFKLTPEGFRSVATWGLDLIPDLSESEIQDKSKANGLAKTIVCLQAIWFCVQCISRWYLSLPISLLELNTFAHALCTLLIFFLWWNKPLNVEGSTMLQGERRREASALILVACMDDQINQRKFRPKDARHAEDVYLDLRPDLAWNYEVHGDRVRVYDEKRLSSPGSLQTYRRATYKWLPYVELSRSEFACFETAMAEMKRLNIRSSGGYKWLALTTTEWGAPFEGRAIFWFVIAGLCYGGIHLSAWNAPFPNPLQALLWKISAASLAASGPLVLFFSYAVLVSEHLARMENDCKAAFQMVGAMLSIGLYVGFVLLYLFSRLYLVVECFISLAHLPDAVYRVPVWSQYYPHVV